MTLIFTFHDQANAGKLICARFFMFLQLKKAATVCRPATNLCDLPETCNGKDEFCPNDYYHADGKPCTIDSVRLIHLLMF